MNFSGLIVGSRFASFMDMVDMLLEFREVGEMDRETMLWVLRTEWDKRMNEWGWDVQEFYNLLTDFE